MPPAQSDHVVLELLGTALLQPAVSVKRGFKFFADTTLSLLYVLLLITI
jgi:hypothetical protein